MASDTWWAQLFASPATQRFIFSTNCVLIFSPLLVHRPMSAQNKQNMKNAERRGFPEYFVYCVISHSTCSKISNQLLWHQINIINIICIGIVVVVAEKMHPHVRG